MRAVPGARGPDIQIKPHGPAEIRRGEPHKVDNSTADGFRSRIFRRLGGR